MSDILHADTFHGTKKGMRRKTVSKRRAYVNTPSQRRKAIKLLNTALAEILKTDGRFPAPDNISKYIIEARDILR